MKASNYSELYFVKKDRLIKENFIEQIRQDASKEVQLFLKDIYVPLILSIIELDIYISILYVDQNPNFFNYFNILMIYLIKFPFVDPIYLFQRYKADINYKDSFGLTVLMHLIINKKKICKISEDHYYIIFTHLIKADNLKIELTNNNGISAFGLSLINGDFLDSFGIYGNFIKHKPQFDFEILIFIIN